MLGAKPLRQLTMAFQMQRLAMHWYGNTRPEPAIQGLQFAAAWMAGDMHQFVAFGDDVDALQCQRILDAPDGLFVSRNGFRRKDDLIASGERYPRMFTSRDPGQRSPAFALRPGAQQHHLVTRQIAVVVLRKKLHVVWYITGIPAGLHHEFHGAPRQHHMPPGFLRRAGHRQQPGQIGGKCGDCYPLWRPFNERRQIARHIMF